MKILYQYKYTHTHTEKSILILINFKPNLDCNYLFSMDIAPNRIPCLAKSIQKIYPNLI